MNTSDAKIVLLVEDNEVNAELAYTLLTRAGMDVRIAETAAAALHSARDVSPDIILMDLNLPDGDGLSVVRTLRTEPDFTETPIIALTAFAMSGDEERALGAGCNGYIAKPFDTRSFVSRIGEIVSASR